MVSLKISSKLEMNQEESLPKYFRGIPLCTHLSGSYTLEAAIIFPLTVGFWMSIMLFFRILQIQTAVEQSIDYAGRITAVESSVVTNDTGILATAEGLFLKELNSYPLVDKYVLGGKYGISLLESDVSGDILVYKAVYRVKLPVAFFAIKTIGIEQNSCHRKWTGRSDGETDSDSYVYVTETGEVYHLASSCNYLDLSIHGVEMAEIQGLRNKSGHKYSACSCVAEKNLIYITDYGERYHSRLDCSGIKRTVHMVKKSQVGSKRLCSKCGNHH